MDTENKRRSVVGIYGLVTVPPVPDLTMDSADRRHVSALYAMTPNERRYTFWVPVKQGSTTWKGRDESSTTWNNVDKPSAPAWLTVNETQD